MNVIEISPLDPLWSVHAQADDIVVYLGVGYRVIASCGGQGCSLCDCFVDDECDCLPFNCLSTDEYPYGTHLVRVCPEEGGEK